MLGLALALSSCVGQTDPATNVSNVSATLNAHGFTNDGPAEWWWEYDRDKFDLGTSRDTEVCGNPPQPDGRCGPAEGGTAANPIPLRVTITGLSPGITYFFRACGQDLNDPAPSCGSILSFRTLTGTSYAFDRQWVSQGPTALAVDLSSNVYVVEGHRIRKFTSSGGFITQWAIFDPGEPGDPRVAGGVATDRAGNVYVADRSTLALAQQAADRSTLALAQQVSPIARIQKFTSTGHLITAWDPADGDVGQPQGVAVDSGARVYVTDIQFDRVTKFTSSGSFIRQFSGQFSFPLGVAADSSGNVYVADTGNQRIQKFTSSGSLLRAWGSFGSGDGEFDFPAGIATDSANNVYVAEIGSGALAPEPDRIQKFTPTGRFITKFGSFGSADGQFDDPRGIAVDPFGNVYVADTGNNRIQKFKPVE